MHPQVWLSTLTNLYASTLHAAGHGLRMGALPTSLAWTGARFGKRGSTSSRLPGIQPEATTPFATTLAISGTRCTAGILCLPRGKPSLLE